MKKNLIPYHPWAYFAALYKRQVVRINFLSAKEKNHYLGAFNFYDIYMGRPGHGMSLNWRESLLVNSFAGSYFDPSEHLACSGAASIMQSTPPVKKHVYGPTPKGRYTNKKLARAELNKRPGTSKVSAQDMAEKWKACVLAYVPGANVEIKHTFHPWDIGVWAHLVKELKSMAEYVEYPNEPSVLALGAYKTGQLEVRLDVYLTTQQKLDLESLVEHCGYSSLDSWTEQVIKDQWSQWLGPMLDENTVQNIGVAEAFPGYSIITSTSEFSVNLTQKDLENLHRNYEALVIKRVFEKDSVSLEATDGTRGTVRI